MRLSKRDSKAFIGALLNPPEPGVRLVKAAEHHRRVGGTVGQRKAPRRAPAGIAKPSLSPPLLDGTLQARDGNDNILMSYSLDKTVWIQGACSNQDYARYTRGCIDKATKKGLTVLAVAVIFG